jgi:hypothetical protein
MKPEISLLCPLETATLCYPKVTEQIHTFQPYLYKVKYNTTLPSTPSSSKQFLSFDFAHRNHLIPCERESGFHWTGGWVGSSRSTSSTKDKIPCLCR